MSVATQLMTADELLAHPRDGMRRELIEGELSEMEPAGLIHGAFGFLLARPLGNWMSDNDLGIVTLAGTGFQISQQPDTVLAPDVGFIAKGRLPADLTTIRGFFLGAPDLAVEVVSPGDTYEQVETKTARYLDAGTQLVWIVRPRQKRVEVHRADDTSALLSERETLSGESVVPGFELPVARVFGA